ncbi:TraB/GumN family protein [Chitinophaga sancti]|uniref:TraB/GumN family protein n=1 Tax=Chitinophaga sancti TaxID=1004 RepID=UPI003F7A8297
MKIPHTLLLLFLTFSAKSQQLFWRITGPHTPHPSYLLGTTYSTGPAAFNFNDSVLIALQQAQGFAMEVDYDSLFEGIRRAKYEGEEEEGNPIRAYLSKEEYDFADKLVYEKNHQHIEDFHSKHLAVIASRITGENLLPLVGDEYPQFWLSLQADKLGKTTYHLEKVKNQLDLLFPKTVTPGFKKEFLIKIGYLKADGSAPDLHLESRDEEMAVNFAKHFETESVFAAVDSVHISGLVKQFRQQGYTVTAVNAPTTAIAKLEREKLDKMTWFTLNKKEEGFSVELPFYPKQVKSDGRTNERYYIGGDNSSGGVVAIQDIMDQRLSQDTIFKNNLANYTRKFKGVAIATTPITFKGHTGIAASAGAKEGIWALRMFIVNNRLFSFMYGGKDTSSRDRFFNSVMFYDYTPQVVYDTFAITKAGLSVVMPSNRFAYREATYTDTYKAVDNEHHISYYLNTYLPPAGGQNDDGRFELLYPPKSVIENCQKTDSINYLRNGLAAYTVKYKHADGLISRKDVIKRGSAVFTLISTYHPNSTDSSYAKRFFNSFQLAPFQKKASWQTFTDNDSSFTVKTPVKLRYNSMVNGWENLVPDKRMIYSAWDTATQSRYRISVMSFEKYEQKGPAYTSENFITPDSNQVVINTKSYKGIVPAWEVELQDKDHHTREYRKAFISGQTAYIIQAFLPEELAKSGNGQQFLSSFRLLKREGATLQDNKLAVLIQDLKSKDEEVAEKANERFAYYHANADEIPIVLNGIRDTAISEAMKVDIFRALDEVPKNNVVHEAELLFSTLTDNDAKLKLLNLLSGLPVDSAIRVFIRLAAKTDITSEAFSNDLPFNDSLYYRYMPAIIDTAIQHPAFLNAFINFSWNDSIWLQPKYGLKKLVPVLIKKFYSEADKFYAGEIDDYFHSLSSTAYILAAPGMPDDVVRGFQRMVTDSFLQMQCTAILGLINQGITVDTAIIGKVLSNIKFGHELINNLERDHQIDVIKPLLTQDIVARTSIAENKFLWFENLVGIEFLYSVPVKDEVLLLYCRDKGQRSKTYFLCGPFSKDATKPVPLHPRIVQEIGDKYPDKKEVTEKALELYNK